ncbi:LysR family transcriptional regulator [Sphingopyxis granuli]|nr:LysR family transcriptional regulator [Sphingopyxis granuli]
MLDVEGMAAFLAVVETTSFSRATDRLGVAQSVVSKRLKRLEDQLGASLFDRTIRTRIALTHVGANYMSEVRATLDQLRKAERIGRNLARGASGPLRIGYIFSAAMNGTLHGVLSALGTALPEITVEVQMMETPEQLAALADGRLDLGLVRPRGAFPEKCDAALVHREQLVIGHSADHPLAESALIIPAELRDQRFIIPQFRERVGLVEYLERLAASGGFVVADPIRTADFVTAAAMAAAGLGVVLAPASIAELGMKGIRFRTVDGFAENIETFLLHRHDAPPYAMDVIAARVPRIESA